MLTANELRIGNWVYDLPINEGGVGNGNMQVDGEVFCDFGMFSFTGIALTPEILEKAGFKKWDFKSNVYQLDCNDGENIQVRGNEVFLAGNEACIDGHGFHCKKEYIHQLQNLYFALTGEELKINL